MNRQDAAVTAANQLINLMQQLKSFRSASADFIKASNSEAFSTTWGAMATAAQNADGSLGTVDGTPVAGHPMTSAALSKAVSSTMLTAGITLLNQMANFFANVAVVTAQYSQTVDDLAS